MADRIRTYLRSNVVAFLALFFALSGSAVAANTVFSGDIVDGEVKTADLATGAATVQKLATNSVNGNKIIDGQVGAADIGNQAVANAELANAAVTNTKLANNAVNSNKIANGSILGLDVANDTLTGAQIDESTLTGVPAANAWSLSGNGGTTAANFLGTTDNQPLDVRVNDARALRLEPASDLGSNPAPNVIGGSADNSVTPGVFSATIGGGGRADPDTPASGNRVTDNGGTVAGGANNQAGDGAGTANDRRWATVGGGVTNNASGDLSTVAGGFINLASGDVATVGGGQSNWATGLWSTVPGGVGNLADGAFSFAGGSFAQANHEGSMVFGDSNIFEFPSTADDQFSVRATGGTRLVSGIDGAGNPTSGLELPGDTTALSALTNGKPLDLRVNGARGLRIDPASDGTDQSPNVIGGTADNSVSAGVHAATIGGGGRSFPSVPGPANRVTDDEGTIGGGAGNQAGDAAGGPEDRRAATVGGGEDNSATGAFATVAGGRESEASGEASMVAGGDANHAEGDHSFAAGSGALANDDGSFVWSDAAGFFYGSTDPNTFNVRAIGGMELVSGIDGTTHTPNTGLRMRPNSSGWEAMAGQPFDLFVNQNRAFRIEPASDGSGQSPNMIGGTQNNTVTAGVHSAVIAGGGRGTPANPATANRVTDSQGVIGGGANNQAGNAAGTVGDRTLATVGGGGNNTASGEISTVAGGFFNTASGGRAAVGGGESNTASGLRSTVAGGHLNAASGLRASVGGGQSNQATAQDAVVGGGGNNTASGVFSGVPSGSSNTAQGDYSLAAGRRAQATQPGTFVWADSTNLAFSSTVANQFSVRSTGGARFVSAVDPTTGAPTAGVELAPGGGSWSSLSDAASKRAIEPVSGRSVLRRLADVPISEWSYRAQDRSIRHIGPMAQDFYRAFGVGESRRRISSVDADGVALAAIQGLSRKVKRLQHAVRILRQEGGSR